MDESPSRIPLYVGVLLIVAGWVALFVGWQQAGDQELETGQLPFLLSGGFGGAGLLLLGAVAVLIDVIRQAEHRTRRQAAKLREAIVGLAEILAERVPVAEEKETGRRGRTSSKKTGTRSRSRS